MNYKWIFKIKYNANGSVIKHNTHLVAKGFTQVEGTDFNETFSLIAWMESIQVLLIVTTIEYLKVHQTFVKIIFLNGNISKKIYMQQPKGFVVKGKENI